MKRQPVERCVDAWRPVADEDLPKLTDMQVLFIALADVMAQLGSPDEVLIEELDRRGQRGLTVALTEKKR